MTECGLHLNGFEVVTNVTANVFVAVAFGGFAQLPFKPLKAGVAVSHLAAAIMTPVTERFNVPCKRIESDNTAHPSL